MSDGIEGDRFGQMLENDEFRVQHAKAQPENGLIAIYQSDPNAIAKGMDPINPTPDMVSLESIAHATAFTCRFGGHVRYFYSVAQHCLYVAAQVPPHLRLRALLHDASEAYLTDIPRPYKQSIPGYKKIEERVQNAIGKHFGVPNLAALEPEIHEADRIALGHEANSFMPINAHWYGEHYRQAIADTAHLPKIHEEEHRYLPNEAEKVAHSMRRAAHSMKEYEMAVKFEVHMMRKEYHLAAPLAQEVLAVYARNQYEERK